MAKGRMCDELKRPMCEACKGSGWNKVEAVGSVMPLLVRCPSCRGRGRITRATYLRRQAAKTEGN